jgi:CheY-like chemotaxis protein/HPt (histidine-containing phosphotransfer) domain-containing protein
MGILRLRLTVTVRLLLALVALAAGTTALVVAVQERTLSRDLERAAAERLDRAAHAADQLVAGHLSTLDERYRAVSGTPQFRAKMLAALGLSVVLAEDGIAALAALERERFDAVLMDCQMPRMDGLEATRRLRERERAAGQPPTPVVALTANAMESDRRSCLEAGMDDCLGKPFTSVQLLLALRHWLAPSAPAEAAPAAAAPAAGEAAVDLRALDELRAVDPERGARIVARAAGVFLGNTPLLLDRIAKAADGGDADDLRAGAHALKSSAAQLGASRLSALARELEQPGRDGTLAAAPPLVEAASAEYERVREALAPWTDPA